MNPVKKFYKSFYKTEFLQVIWGAERKTLLRAPDRRQQLKRRLESRFKRNVVLMQSGRAALRLAIRELHLEGSPIAVPSFICGSVLRAVVAEGCTLVFIELNDDYTINLRSLKKAITKHQIAAAIVPHFGGIATNIHEVLGLCGPRGVAVIEDAAQSFGLMIGDNPSGSIADVGILSFGIGKVLSSYEGGALLLKKKRSIDSLPSKEPSFSRKIGFLMRYVHGKTFLPFFLVKDALLKQRNDPLLETRALSKADSAVMISQLEKLDFILKRREENARTYSKRLPKNIKRPPTSSVYLKYMVEFKTRKERDAAAQVLREHRIETEGTYPLQHLKKKWRQYPAVVRKDNRYERLLTLPCHPGLEKKDIERICAVLEEHYA